MFLRCHLFYPSYIHSNWISCHPSSSISTPYSSSDTTRWEKCVCWYNFWEKWLFLMAYFVQNLIWIEGFWNAAYCDLSYSKFTSPLPLFPDRYGDYWPHSCSLVPLGSRSSSTWSSHTGTAACWKRDPLEGALLTLSSWWWVILLTLRLMTTLCQFFVALDDIYWRWKG